MLPNGPAQGTVALALELARWTHLSRLVSDHESQFGERGSEAESGGTSVPRS
jgi:hypothetical protein